MTIKPHLVKIRRKFDWNSLGRVITVVYVKWRNSETLHEISSQLFVHVSL